jgi:hypothetical protein
MRQISVFLENVPGRLATLCNTLEVNGINLRAMTTSEGSDYGVVRMLVDDVDAAETVLRDANLPFSTVEVLTVEVSDQPGALGKVAVQLAEAGINVEYAYAASGGENARALCVVKVADPAAAEVQLGLA